MMGLLAAVGVVLALNEGGWFPWLNLAGLFILVVAARRMGAL